MKTQQELIQAYWGPGGIVDTVKEYNAKHGCNVKPWECVKLIGHSGEWENTYGCNPLFDSKAGIFHFALTILYDDKRKEHRPVWEGSELYANNCTKPLTIKGKSEQWGYLSVGECTNYAISILSWNPPTQKRTFKIGDMELPCPKKNGLHTFDISARSPNCNPAFESFHFNSAGELAYFYNIVRDILTASIDKE